MHNTRAGEIRKTNDVIFVIFIIQSFAVENHSSETRDRARGQPSSSRPGPVRDDRVNKSCNEGTVDDVRAELGAFCNCAGDDCSGSCGENILEKPVRVEIVVIFPTLREKILVADEFVCRASKRFKVWN